MPPKDQQAEDESTRGAQATGDDKGNDESGNGDQGKGSDNKDANGDLNFDEELQKLEQRKQSGYTPLQRAEFSLKQTMKQIEDQGGDPYKVLGIERPKDGDKKKTGDDKKTYTAEEIQNLVKQQVEERIGEVRSQFGQAEIDTRVSKLAKSESEGKVIKFHLENTVRSTGDLDEDIENAYLIANKGRIKATMSELVRKADSNDGKTDGQGAGQGDGGQGGNEVPNTVTQAERDFAQRRGLVWDKGANNGKGGFISPRRKQFTERMNSRDTSGRHARRRSN